MNPCPDKHALGLYSKGLRSQNKAATPSRKFARSGAHFRSPRSKDSAIPTGNEFSKTFRGFIQISPAFWNAVRTCESAFLPSFKTYVCNEGRDSGRSAANRSPGFSPASFRARQVERENARAEFVHSAEGLHAGRAVVVRFVHSVAGLWPVVGPLSHFGRRQRIWS